MKRQGGSKEGGDEKEKIWKYRAKMADPLIAVGKTSGSQNTNTNRKIAAGIMKSRENKKPETQYTFRNE